jgi:hypothetical protein
MKLSEVYHMESVDEAIAIAESHRSLEDYLSGDPDRIARTNIWTDVKTHLEKIKADMEAGL